MTIAFIAVRSGPQTQRPYPRVWALRKRSAGQVRDAGLAPAVAALLGRWNW